MECEKVGIMEKCFNGFTELGLHGTGIHSLAKHCAGIITASVYGKRKSTINNTKVKEN